MSDRNRRAALNRRIGTIRMVADQLAKLLREEYDPMLGHVQSAAVDEVNEALREQKLPLQLDQP